MVIFYAQKSWRKSAGHFFRLKKTAENLRRNFLRQKNSEIICGRFFDSQKTGRKFAEAFWGVKKSKNDLWSVFFCFKKRRKRPLDDFSAWKSPKIEETMYRRFSEQSKPEEKRKLQFLRRSQARRVLWRRYPRDHQSYARLPIQLEVKTERWCRNEYSQNFHCYALF